jgi:hypothetical protein
VREEEERLEAKLEWCSKIFDLMEKRVELLTQREEMLADAADPSRLTAKGNRDVGRLLREEKLRAKVNKDLPKMNKRCVATTACASNAYPEAPCRVPAMLPP